MADFEVHLTALESVVERLERGDLSLEDSLRLFEEGMNLSSACKQELEAAEGKIQILIEQRNGTMKAANFDAVSPRASNDKDAGEDTEDTEDNEDGE
jgi:exodeoxyribonuclease VII small subunit